MKKSIISLLSLAVLMLGCTGVTKAGGCPDGSEPVRSISADGSYFIYNCDATLSASSQNENVVNVVEEGD